MGWPIKLLKLSTSIVNNAIPPVNSIINFFLYKIFLELKKYILFIFKYKNNTSLNEILSSFQKAKKGGPHETF
jgi:hypothetical protein